MMITTPAHSSAHSAAKLFTRRTVAEYADRKPAVDDHFKYCSVASCQKWDTHQNLRTHYRINPSVYHRAHQNIQLQDELWSAKHAQKIRDVRNQLKAAEREASLVDLTLVDAIQKLGIDHHFQEEIQALLQKHYNHFRIKNRFLGHSGRPTIYQVSLSFRILRQQGYYVVPDVFYQFMEEKGRFNMKSEKSDIKALMALYEAAQLSIEGEDILDAAEKFSSQLLNVWTRFLEDNNAKIIQTALRHPYRKSLARLKPMNLMMTDFEGINGLGKCLRELSYSENSMARRIHRQELLQISKWWDDLGIAKELKNARDQPLKWYTWPMACLSDLSMSNERMDLTKTISFIYLIDDIFDLYGNPEDLNLFTQAVKRWDIGGIDELPEYMKKCFMAVYSITNEAALNIQKKHGFNPIQPLRKAWGDLCSAFLVESQWFASRSYKSFPKADEYLENGKVSSGIHVVLVHLFYLLGFGTSERSPVNLDDASPIISSQATILRLWDDLGSSKDEGQTGFDGSYVDYLVNENGVSVECAREHVNNMISDEWKRLNKGYLGLNQSSSSFQKASLNVARMVPLMYSYNNNQRLPHLHNYIHSMLGDDYYI